MTDSDQAFRLLAQAFRCQLASDMHDDAIALEVLASVLRRTEGEPLADLLERIGQRVRRYAVALSPEASPKASARSVLQAAGAEPHPDQLEIELKH